PRIPRWPICGSAPAACASLTARPKCICAASPGWRSPKARAGAVAAATTCPRRRCCAPDSERVDELVLIPPRASTESLGYVWPPGTSSTSSMGGLAADTELSGCRVDELVLLPPRSRTQSLGYAWTPGTSSTSSMGGLAADTMLSGSPPGRAGALPSGPLKLRLDLDQCPLRPQGAESPADIEHRELPCNWSVPQAVCLPSRQRCGRVPMLST